MEKKEIHINTRAVQGSSFSEQMKNIAPQIIVKKDNVEDVADEIEQGDTATEEIPLNQAVKLDVTAELEAELREIELERQLDEAINTLKTEFGSYHEISLQGQKIDEKISFDSRYNTFFVKDVDGGLQAFDTRGMKAYLYNNKYEILPLEKQKETLQKVETKKPLHEEIWQKALKIKGAKKNSSNTVASQTTRTPEPHIVDVADFAPTDVKEPFDGDKRVVIKKSQISAKTDNTKQLQNKIEPIKNEPVIMKNKIEPAIVEPVADPAIELVAEPIADPAIEPTFEPVIEQVKKTEASVPITTETFEVKSVMLEQFLHNKSLRGKRTNEELEQLHRDIKQAASRVLDGEDTATVIASLGLNNPTKVSKSMAQKLPEILQAEFVAHFPALKQEDADQKITNNDNKEVVQSTSPEILEPVIEVAAPEKNPEKNNDPIDFIISPDIEKKELHTSSVDENASPEQTEVFIDNNLNKILTIEDAPVTESLIENHKQESRDNGDAFEVLKQNLIAAREAYAQEDYKKTTAWDNLKRFFGRSMAKDEDEGVLLKKSDYQKSLTAFLEAKLQIAREESADNEALKANLVEVLKFAEISERMYLYDARTDAKIPPKILSKIQSGVDWYRNLPTMQKVAFSGVMVGVGFGIGASAGAGAASAAFFAKRLFGGAVAGRGIYEMTENISQEVTAKKQDAFIDTASIDIEQQESAEEMMTRIQEYLYASTTSSDLALNNLMKNRLRATVAGFATGAFFGAGFPSMLVEKLQGVMAISENASMRLPDISAGAFNVPEAVAQETSAHIAQEAIPVPLVHLEINAGSGDGIESQLIDHLKQSGHSLEDAGKMAHRMLLDFAHEKGVSAEEYNSLLSGSITLDPESLHIQNIEMTPLAGHDVPAHSQAIHSRMFLPEHTPAESVSRTLAEGLPLESAIVNAVESFDAPSIEVPTAEAVVSEVLATEVVSESERKEIAMELVNRLTQNKRELWGSLKTMTIDQIQKDTTGAYDAPRKFIIQYLKEHDEKLTTSMRKSSVLSFVAEHAKLGKR